MLANTSRWSHAHGNTVVPSRWQATKASDNSPMFRILAAMLGRFGLGVIDHARARQAIRGVAARVSPLERADNIQPAAGEGYCGPAGSDGSGRLPRKR